MLNSIIQIDFHCDFKYLFNHKRWTERKNNYSWIWNGMAFADIYIRFHLFVGLVEMPLCERFNTYESSRLLTVVDLCRHAFISVMKHTWNGNSWYCGYRPDFYSKSPRNASQHLFGFCSALCLNCDPHFK